MGNGITAYGFTSEWTDGTGLVNLRARYYDPVSGRFVSRDSWGGDYQNPITLNKWVYANTNPMRYTDPSGLIAQGDEDKAATAILNDLKSRFGVVIVKDWGVVSVPDIWHHTYHCGWQTGSWRNVHELELTQNAIQDMVQKIGGINKFKSALMWQVRIRRNSEDNPAGRAFIDIVLYDGGFNYGDQFAMNVVVHEMAHVWDARRLYSISTNMMKITNSYKIVCVNNAKVKHYCSYTYDSANAFETAPTTYAQTNAAEDWAESIMTYVYSSSGNLGPIRKDFIERTFRDFK